MVSCPICRGKFAPFERIRAEFRNSQADSLLPVHPPTSVQTSTPSHSHIHMRKGVFKSQSNSASNRQTLRVDSTSLRPVQSPSPSTQTNPASTIAPVQIFTKAKLKKLMHSLRTLKITSARAKLLEPGRQCVLCFHAYQLGDTIVRLTTCCHQFHRECLEQYVHSERAPNGGKVENLTEAIPVCPIDGRPLFPTPSEQQPEQDVNSALHRNATDRTQQLSIGRREHNANKNMSVALSLSGHRVASMPAGSRMSNTQEPQALANTRTHTLTKRGQELVRQPRSSPLHHHTSSSIPSRDSSSILLDSQLGDQSTFSHIAGSFLKIIRIQRLYMNKYCICIFLYFPIKTSHL